MPLTGISSLGPYQIESLLGAGGMGEVYRARDSRLNRPVALKVLRADQATGEGRQRFLQEARAASALNHPHIVTVYDVGTQGGIDYIAMEFVDGESLATVLSRGPLLVKRAVAYAVQVADALARAHEAGIIHRDIKPANVMIGRDERVKVLDFGVAKLIDEARRASISLATSATTMLRTSEGSIVGTVAYMSPEQAEGLAVDARTDIFAFGAMMYEMIAGRPAFQRDSPIGTLSAILREQPAPLQEIRPDLPNEIVRIVTRCLRKEPARRFQTMADLHVALQDVLEDLESTPARATQTQTLTRSARFGRWLLPALAGATIVLGIAAFMAWRSSAVPLPAPPVLTRMTADEGLTADPAISANGTLLAYASDRGGNLDIWVQQVAGGTPLQLTHDEIDEREPAFSPDGSRIVFRSERSGGSVYTVSTFGAEQPRLLAERGRRPQFSPDGQQVAYWTGTYIGFAEPPGSYRTYVVPAAGGTPREISGMTGARFPVWSPNGRALLVLGSRAEPPMASSYDWWLVPLNGDAPMKTGIAERLLPLRVDLANLSVGPDAWQDGRVYFSDLGDLWSIPLDENTGIASEPERMNLGTSQDVQPVVSRNGMIAFSTVESSNNIWAQPLDSNRGIAAGSARKITTGVGRNARASMSADGTTIAYVSDLPRRSLLVRNIGTGKVTDLGVSQTSAFGPALSPDGSMVAYEYTGGTRGSEVSGVRVVPANGGASRVVCERCQIGEWSNDSRSLVGILGRTDEPDAASQGNARRFVLISVDTTSRRDLVTSATYTINRPHFSPNNRLLAFRGTANALDSVFVVSLHSDRTVMEDEWIRIVVPESDARPCGWSEDGTMIYILSSRDGTRCLYAQRVDPETGRPIGPLIEVQHFHGIRNWRPGAAGVISTSPSNAIRVGTFLFDYATYTANIWTMTVTP